MSLVTEAHSSLEKGNPLYNVETIWFITSHQPNHKNIIICITIIFVFLFCDFHTINRISLTGHFFLLLQPTKKIRNRYSVFLICTLYKSSFPINTGVLFKIVRVTKVNK